MEGADLKERANSLGDTHDMDIAVGPLTLTFTTDPVSITGEAFTGGHQKGTTIPAQLQTPDGALIELGLTSWEHGDRDVRCFNRLTGPPLYDRLIKGARLGVQAKRADQWDVELGILRHHDTRPATVVKAGWDDFDAVLGANAQQMLTSRGATAVGTKDAVIADTGKRRGYLMMLSPAGDPQPVFAAYLLTRVLPLMTGFGSHAAVPIGQA